MDKVSASNLHGLGFDDLSAVITYHQDESVRAAALMAYAEEADSHERLAIIMQTAPVPPASVEEAMRAAISRWTKLGHYRSVSELLRAEGLPKLDDAPALCEAAVNVRSDRIVAKEPEYDTYGAFIAIPRDPLLPDPIREAQGRRMVNILAASNDYEELAEVSGMADLPQAVRDAAAEETEPAMTRAVFAAGQATKDAERTVFGLCSLIKKDGTSDQVKLVAVTVVVRRMEKPKDLEALLELAEIEKLPSEAVPKITQALGRIALTIIRKRMDDWIAEQGAKAKEAKLLVPDGLSRDDPAEKEYYQWKSELCRTIAASRHFPERVRNEAGTVLYDLHRRFGKADDFGYSYNNPDNPPEMRRRMGLAALERHDAGKDCYHILGMAYGEDGVRSVQERAKEMISERLDEFIAYCGKTKDYRRLTAMSNDEAIKGRGKIGQDTIDNVIRQAIAGASQEQDCCALRRMEIDEGLDTHLRAEAGAAIGPVLDELVAAPDSQDVRTNLSSIKNIKIFSESERVRAGKRLADLCAASGDTRELESFENREPPEELRAHVVQALEAARLNYVAGLDPADVMGIYPAYLGLKELLRRPGLGPNVESAAMGKLDAIALAAAARYASYKNHVSLKDMRGFSRLSAGARRTVELLLVDTIIPGDWSELSSIAKDASFHPDAREAAALKTVAYEGASSNDAFEFACDAEVPLAGRAAAARKALADAEAHGRLKETVHLMNDAGMPEEVRQMARDLYPAVLAAASAKVVRDSYDEWFFDFLRLTEKAPDGVEVPRLQIMRSAACDAFMAGKEQSRNLVFFMHVCERAEATGPMKENAGRVLREAGLTLFDATAPLHDAGLKEKYKLFIRRRDQAPAPAKKATVG